MSARLLVISASSDFDAAVAKGNLALLNDFDEGGYFAEVIIAFPFAARSRRVQISERVTVLDIGWEWLPGARASRAVKRLLAPVQLWRIVRMLARTVRHHHIDIIRATDPLFAGPIGWAVSRLTRRPFCVSIHADFDKRHALSGTNAGADVLGSRALARPVEQFVLRRADLVMPIRESLREYALTRGVLSNRIRVIPHGADLELFVTPSAVDVRTLFRLSRSARIISFAGRLIQENYVGDVLRLATAVGKVRPDVIFLILGGGPDSDQIQAAVAASPVLQQVVRLVGSQPRPVVAAVRQASSVSLCLMGGFSLIEACAAASPVVAYDVEWHAELIRDGISGFLVAECDLNTLRSRVEQLLDDTELGSRLGQAARELALQRHSLGAAAQIKRRCYDELLTARQAG